MSELKITENSLENAILKDGQFVSGYVTGSGYISASGNGAHAEGYITEIGGQINASGHGAIARGYVDDSGSIIATRDGAHAEGYADNGEINATGHGAITMGYAYDGGHINASGDGAHAEGYAYFGGKINAIGHGAHAEGYVTDNGEINAIGHGAHAEGINTQTLANGAHAEGAYTKAAGINSHAEGEYTIASGAASHAEGYNTTASANYSHTGGVGTIANQEAMTAIGKFNVLDNTNTLFVVGDGTSGEDVNRSDAFRVNSCGSNTGTISVPSSVQAKVNGVSDVYLGCPIGTIVMWAGETAPEGWLLCDGSKILISGNDNINQIIQGKSIQEHELNTLIGVMIINGNTPYKSFTTVYNDTSKYVKDYNIIEDQNTDNVSVNVLEWTATVDDAAAFYLSSNKNYTFFYNSGEIAVTQYYTMLLPNLQQRFPIGAKIGGVGNIIKNIGSLELYYSNTERYYVGDLKIGQFLDLTDAQGLQPSSIYTSYCVIVDIIKEFDNQHYVINVIECDKFGKITNKTSKNLFEYFNYTSATSASRVVNGIKINENSTILGSTGGEETHILTLNEMPSHHHGIEQNTSLKIDHSNNGVDRIQGGPGTNLVSGGNQAHNNIPPYLAINFIIKYK